MCLKKCASEVREARKKGRRGNKRPAMDLGERVGKKARGNVPKLAKYNIHGCDSLSAERQQ